MVKDKRAWGSVWWTYAHLNRACISTVPIVGLADWRPQIQQGIDHLIIDFAPLPKGKRESSDELATLQEESMITLVEILNELMDA